MAIEVQYTISDTVTTVATDIDNAFEIAKQAFKNNPALQAVNISVNSNQSYTIQRN